MNWQSSRIRVSIFLLFALLVGLAVAAVATADGYGYTYIYVSAKTDGTTADGLEYGPADIIGSTGVPASWFTYFDASAYGLTSHNINAFDFDVPGPTGNAYTIAGPIYMTFEQNSIRVPGVADPVRGQDVVRFEELMTSVPGYEYAVYFDGSDVGLTLSSEKIDSLTVYTPEDFLPSDIDVPTDCSAGVLFISTNGNYRVPAPDGSSLVGRGSDILAFCATNLGNDTAGFWFKAFDGVAAGFSPNGAMRNISVHDFDYDWVASVPEWELEFTFSATAPFTLGLFSGDPNVVYLYDSEEGIEATIRDLTAEYPGINGKADGLTAELTYYTCTGVCP